MKTSTFVCLIQIWLCVVCFESTPLTTEIIRFYEMLEYQFVQSKTYPLRVTLEEVLTGCTKRVKFFWTNNFGRREEKIIFCSIERGCEDEEQLFQCWIGKDFVFRSLTIVVECASHRLFQRDGADIIHEIQLSKRKIRKGRFTLDVPTLNGQTVSLDVDCRQDDEYTLQGYGLPFRDGGGRGDLIVQLNGFKDPLLEVPIQLTLEELFRGCIKQVKVHRKSFENGRSFVETVDFSVDVDAGSRSGDRITYEDEGHFSSACSEPGDLVFIVQELPHALFKRYSANLHYTVVVTSTDPLEECTVLVPTLHPLEPQMEVCLRKGQKSVRLAGFGFPQNAKKRGDLVVNFSYQLE